MPDLRSADTRPAPLVCLADAGSFRSPPAHGSAGRRDGARQLNEQDFGDAFEHSAMGMALVAPDAKPLRVNQAFCDMLGYTRAEMLSLSVADITHPDDVAEHLDQWARIIAG